MSHALSRLALCGMKLGEQFSAKCKIGLELAQFCKLVNKFNSPLFNKAWPNNWSKIKVYTNAFA